MKATYIRHMGTDLDVVNNARVSFGKTSDWCPIRGTLKETDKKLIEYLARGMPESELDDLVRDLGCSPLDKIKRSLLEFRKTPTHWAPFANGIRITFHVKAPIPIMRQLFKHKVGAEEDEMSRRYVDDAPEFFYPEWREKAENVKQGSGGLHDGDIWYEDDFSIGNFSLNGLYRDFVSQAKGLYNAMIAGGVCPEQARFVLPQATMTEAIISHSLYGWANLYNQRANSHAQLEVQDLANDIGSQVAPLFPVSWKALTGASPVEAPTPTGDTGGPLWASPRPPEGYWDYDGLVDYSKPRDKLPMKYYHNGREVSRSEYNRQYQVNP